MGFRSVGLSTAVLLHHVVAFRGQLDGPRQLPSAAGLPAGVPRTGPVQHMQVQSGARGGFAPDCNLLMR